MGFPRILSKNNKIYTKLGEFCLSGESSFWIVCQVCQEEFQTQDQFWKHIQDEHNFLHGMGLKQEPTTRNYMESESITAHLLPLPLYRRVNEEELRTSGGELDPNGGGDNSQEKQEPKDYTEMRAIEPNAAQIDIKVEPPNISHALAMAAAVAAVTQQPGAQHVQQQQQHSIGSNGGGEGGGGVGGGGGSSISESGGSQSNVFSIGHQNVDVNTSAASSAGGGPTIPQTIYHLTPQVSAASSSYASAIVHNTTNAVAMTAGMPAGAMAAAAAMMSSHEMSQLKKESQHSTTASASSAVSSEDGERWYVCDHETCGLKFKYQSRLELHRAVHSKERRFACELCGASFKQSCNLSTHRKKKHFLKGSKSLVPPSHF